MNEPPTPGDQSGLHDAVLLAPAALLLRGYGYWTEPVALPDGRTLLLAENDYFVFGVTEFAGAGDLSAAEASATAGLVDRLPERQPGAKHWDIYLVLLSTATRSGDDMPEAVTSIVYNTRYLRRIVRWDVTPDDVALARALQAFLPLPAPPEGRSVPAVELLSEKLTQFGIEPEAARLAIRQWQETLTHG